ncbi:hypothetical protein O3P69_003270 [Scylla paramamosain]|uniref:Uncharacterized protein n=1 Tax=Scylla paramamosain TaxID=85552 RepID=A0AAW0ULC4_SCYPA
MCKIVAYCVDGASVDYCFTSKLKPLKPLSGSHLAAEPDVWAIHSASMRPTHTRPSPSCRLRGGSSKTLTRVNKLSFQVEVFQTAKQ